MKEFDRDVASTARADFGVDRTRPVKSGGLVSPSPRVPVHANMDAPFKPLVPFVPEDHWDRMQAPETPSVQERLTRLWMDIGKIKRRMRRNVRRMTIIRR